MIIHSFNWKLDYKEIELYSVLTHTLKWKWKKRRENNFSLMYADEERSRNIDCYKYKRKSIAFSPKMLHCLNKFSVRRNRIRRKWKFSGVHSTTLTQNTYALDKFMADTIYILCHQTTILFIESFALHAQSGSFFLDLREMYSGCAILIFHGNILNGMAKKIQSFMRKIFF